jgi:hypothetical protein
MALPPDGADLTGLMRVTTGALPVNSDLLVDKSDRDEIIEAETPRFSQDD